MEANRIGNVLGRQTLGRIGSHDLRVRTTPAEEILWSRLRGRLAGLEFRRHQDVHGFIANFFCFDAALIVELHGIVHERQREYDAQRDRLLAERGILVLRFSNDEVMRCPQAVVEQIKHAAAAHHLNPKIHQLTAREIP